MFLFYLNYITDVIYQSDNIYDMEGKIMPTFHNEGTAKVKINDQTVYPGQSYEVNIPGGVINVKFKIEFIEEPNTTKLVLVKYGRYGGPYLNPATVTLIQPGAMTTCNS